MTDSFEITTEIKASATNIWKAITNPEYIKKYMFGSYTKCEWKIGNDIIYYINHEAKETPIVSGKIIDIVEPTTLKLSLYPVGASYPNIDKNHIFITYRIEEHNNSSTLKIYQDGFDTASDGVKRKADAEGGWQMILPQLKKLAEEL